MDVKDFCNGMEMELTAWKAKLFDAICKAEKLGSADREKAMSNINDIKIIVQDMDDKIERLKKECPAQWSPEKKAIDTGNTDMRAKYEETMSFIGDASPVSIPG